MNNPRVTVCIPAYNCAAFLSEAIESVLCQNFTDFELLIMDDASSDSTREIISRYAGRDSRITARYHPKNLGMVEHWNTCLGAVRGEYVRFLFGDDFLVSRDALGIMVARLDADPKISLVASARNIVDDRSRVLAIKSFFSETTSGRGSDVITRCLLEQKNLVGEPSVVMFRSSQALRGFDSRYLQFVDLEMWFYLLEQGLFAYIDEPLSAFRVHSGQQTRKNLQDFVHIDDMFLLLDEYSGKDYIRMGSITRFFLRYNQCYRIWKIYRQGRIDRSTAECKISEKCDIVRFRCLMPFYKLFSPYLKIRNALSNGLRRTQ
jgi:glycosyltransferase involved in cell wall biosynthesis